MQSTRRGIVRGFGFSSLLSLFPFARNAAAARSTPPNVLKELGIRPLLNFRGTHTVIGASKQWPELHEAMAEISRHFVPLGELQDKVGARIAALMGTEDAYVTTGAAGAITIGTCGCLTGEDTAKVRQLPDLTGMKSEVVILKAHRNGYDHAVRNTGVKIVEPESREQFVNALNANTAMVYFLGGHSGDWDSPQPLPIDEMMPITKKAGVPVMVDAANMLPPWENLRKLAALGVDLICSSGGKHMRGPQCSGILAGRRDLVRAARLNSSPFSDSLGRPMKVGREEIVGAWLAAEKYSKLDFEAIDREYKAQADYLADQLRKIRGMRVSFAPHDKTRRVHRVVAEWDEKALGISGDECEKLLLDGEPRVAVMRQKQAIMFTVFMNDPGDEKFAAKRMREIFSDAKKKA
ncbi:MAG: aminotransferase class V-fold PLP-dependent enzyme [Bryobacteraceae bacterium]